MEALDSYGGSFGILRRHCESAFSKISHEFHRGVCVNTVVALNGRLQGNFVISVIARRDIRS